MENDVTSVTFINLLKTAGEGSWSKFYDNYAPLILNFARKRGCSEEIAEDVLQETIIALYRYLPGFTYERKKGKFRSFLFKITESKIVDSFRKNRRLIQMSDPAMVENKPDEAEDGREARMLWDQAWEENLLTQAIAAARLRVRPMTFRCFEMVFLGERSVKDVASELNISPNLVSQHKHKVYKVIIEEAEKIQQKNSELEGADEDQNKGEKDD